MTTQPEALRLADITELDKYPRHPDHKQHVAAELRRLHEINFNLCRKCNTLTILSARDADKITALEASNQELLAALKMVLSESYDGPLHDDFRSQARAAIAKAEGEQK